MTDTDNPPPKPPRRRVLKWLGAVGLGGIGTGAFALTPQRTNAYYSGPVSDHFDGVRFFNPGGPGPKSISQLLKWQFGSRADAWPDSYPSPFPSARPDPRLPASETRVTFIGHASYLIQSGGLNILFDPVLVDRASPVQFAGPKRVNPPGIAFDQLPKIDVILVSHNHWDHLDVATLGSVVARDKARIITPLGNDAIIAEAVPGARIDAVDWNQQRRLGDGIVLDCVPTQHWSARGTRDRMHALWASFVIKGPKHTVYVVGDSGFGDGSTFKHVASRHAAIDLALLPIGAYEPRWFMGDQHMDPAEAVAALKLCGAKRAIGHHWGTFKLTNEGVDAPQKALTEAMTVAALPRDRFEALRPGQVVTLA